MGDVRLKGVPKATWVLLGFIASIIVMAVGFGIALGLGWGLAIGGAAAALSFLLLVDTDDNARRL